MREYDVRGALSLKELVQGEDESIHCVLRKQRMLHADHLAHALGGSFGGQRLGLCADYYGSHALRRPETQRGRQRLPTDTAYMATALF
jgi:hypothetical protein